MKEWTPNEVADFIKENITLLAFRFRLHSLEKWFRLKPGILGQYMSMKKVRYSAERKEQLKRYIKGHLHLSDDELCYRLDLSQYILDKILKEIEDEKDMRDAEKQD